MNPMRFPALAVALLTTVFFAALADVCSAQFAVDQRLTFAQFPTGTSLNNAWSVATDSRENVHVIYWDARDVPINGDNPPYYRRYDAALAAWQPEFRLPDFLPAMVRDVGIAVDCSNDVHTIWVNHDFATGQGQVYYKRRTPGGGWDPDVPLRAVPVGTQVGDPTIAADWLGNVYALWAEGVEDAGGIPVWNVFYRFYDENTSTWLPVGQLTFYAANVDPPPGARSPTVSVENRMIDPVALDIVTLVHVAWDDANLGNVVYQAMQHDPIGAAVSLVGASLPQLGAGSGSPSIASRCGTIHLVWSSGGALQHRIGTHPPKLALAPFFAPVPTGFFATDPNVAIDGLENAYVSMLVGGSVIAARWSALTGWGGGISYPVSDPPAGITPLSRPSIAVDERGSLHVVWSDERDPFPDPPELYYDRGSCLVAGQPIAPPPPVLASEADGLVGVIVKMRAQPDLRALEARVAPMRAEARREAVVRELQTFARTEQAAILRELDTAAAAGLASNVRSLWLLNAVAVRVAPSLAQALAARPDVELVFPDPLQRMLDAADATARPAAPPAPRQVTSPPFVTVPADTSWGVKWIGAPAVWAQGYRGACIVVAVLDTGVDSSHPDLASHMWLNADESPGNSLDDDSNGYVDDVHGWDYVNLDGEPVDDEGHGTHVAGTVAGDGTAGTLTGVAPQAVIMPIKVLDAFGSGTTGDIINGVGYAVANGAQVLNLSLGVFCPTPAIRDALRLAADAVATSGVTMCVAAGNDRCVIRPPNVTRSPGDIPPPWINPAQPLTGAPSGVTSVGATRDMVDFVTAFSSPGPVDWSQAPTYLDWALCNPIAPGVGLIRPDVAAPGENVPSTEIGGGYGSRSGTSMASPHVAGLTALMLSKNQQILSPTVQMILETTALDIAPVGKDDDTGAGRIRAPNAIAAVPLGGAPVVVVTVAVHDTVGTGDGDGSLEAGETADIVLLLENQSAYPLSDVVGLLATADPYVTVTSALAAFGDLPIGGAALNLATPFRIAVSTSAPDNHPVTFTVAISSFGACTAAVFADTLYAPGTPAPEIAAPLPTTLVLGPARPNPFTGETAISFFVPVAGSAELTVHDVAGRLVATLARREVPSGWQASTWDGRVDAGGRAAAGIYFLRVQAAGEVRTAKIVRLE